MIDPWIWAVLLLVVSMGLAVLEIFFPSAGILGFFAIVSMLGSIYMGFRQGAGTGVAILAVAVMGMPDGRRVGVSHLAAHVAGQTSFASAPTAEEVLPDDADRRHLKSLVGHVGRAKCPMLPGGVIFIDGRTVEAVSEGMAIDVGQAVRVIKVQANRVVVRPLEDERPSETADDPLQRPIESVAPDPFDQPPLDNPSNQG